METVSTLKQTKEALSALWAVDPFDTEHLPNQDALAQARLHIGGSFENTVPVFVCSPYFIDPLSPQEKVRNYLSSLQVSSIQAPQILVSESEKKKDWVRTLLDEAKMKNAELIILTNHGRKGLSKLLAGSFAENLLKESHLPILFLGENPPSESHWNRVLFATDFSEDSHRSLLEFLNFTSMTATELLLFHAITMPTGALSGTHLGGVPANFSGIFWEQQVAWAKKEAKHWIASAKRLNLKTHLHTIVNESVGNPALAVLDMAHREGVSLIGLSSQGPKFFFQSVTEDVLSFSDFEIWVTGPRYKQNSF